MKRLRNMSIKAQLMAIILSVSLLITAIGSSVNLNQEVRQAKADLVDEAALIAELVGEYCVTPLAFDDRAGADEVLGRLSGIPTVKYAYVYDTQGVLFASYGPSGDQRVSGSLYLDKGRSSEFRGDYLHISQPIAYEGQEYGLIRMYVSTDELDERISKLLTLMASVVCGLIVLSYVMAGRLQGLISKPILHLAEVTKRISSEGDYSVHVERTGGREVGDLCDGFNEMLRRIQNWQVERDQAEEALRESRERFRSLVECGSDQIWEIDLEGVYTYISPNIKDTLGRKVDEAIGRSVFDFMSPDESARARELYEGYARRREPFTDIEATHIHKDGRKVLLETSGVPIYDVSGKLIGYRGIDRDVSERRRVAEERTAYHRRIRSQQTALLETATSDPVTSGDLDGACGIITAAAGETLRVARAGIWMIDEQLGEMKCVDMYDRMSGLHSSGDVLKVADYPRYFHALQAGRSIEAHDVRSDPRVADFLPDYLLPQGITSSLDTAVRSHRKLLAVISCEHTGRKRRWQADESAFVCALGDQLAQTFLNTERNASEDELRKLRNLLSNIINSMPSVLVGVDSEGAVTQWNREAERATGVSEDNARGCGLAEVFPALSNEIESIRRSIRDRRPLKNEKVTREIGGEVYYSDVTVYPLLTNGIEGAVIRVDDVTDRVRVEEMMIHSEKMLSVGGLAAGMAHEINNPLAGILQNVQVMRNRLTGDLSKNAAAATSAGTTMEAISTYVTERGLVEMFESVLESGRRAAKIIDNMINFSRKGDLSFAHHDLRELLDKTIELAANDYDPTREYDFRKVEVIREYDSLLPDVSCEAGQIQQVVLNLLKNAAESMAHRAPDITDKPRIVIRVVAEGDMARIEIEDNGTGMDDATRKRIFEPFFTTRERGPGTGLGLSVSYFIITENHGGTMAVETVPEHGAKFLVRIPFERPTLETNTVAAEPVADPV